MARPNPGEPARWHALLLAVRRAFAEFLAIPTFVIAGYLALAVLCIWLDHLRVQFGWPSFVPGTHESFQTLLGTIAASIITVTSITFSLLIVAVQQGAASLTSEVYDQFLRRRANQIYFGFFVGLALYCLVILATVHRRYTPVYGSLVAFVFTVVALYLLILLIYSTIDQMRPVMIVENIRRHTERARAVQLEFLRKTRVALPPGAASSASAGIVARECGYITAIDVNMLCDAALRHSRANAIVVLRSIGDYVSVGEDLLEVHLDAGGLDERATELLLEAVKFDHQRDLDSDASYGIEQLTTIGWTSTSTAKSNPQPGMLACWNLRDLIGIWYGPGAVGVERCDTGFPVVYTDSVPIDLLRALESLAIVASESMQHQTIASVYGSLAFALRYLPPEQVGLVADIGRRSLSALGEHVLTRPLEEALQRLADALEGRGEVAVASEVRAACAELAKSLGTLHSRASRSP